MYATGKIIYSKEPSDTEEESSFSQDINELDRLVARSNKVIFEAISKYPLLFQTNKITICPNRVTITYGRGYAAEERPMLIEQINTARVIHGRFLASIDMETFGVPKPEPVRGLTHMDARYARRYILALVECRKNNLDLEEYSVEELQEKLKELGKVYK